MNVQITPRQLYIAVAIISGGIIFCNQVIPLAGYYETSAHFRETMENIQLTIQSLRASDDAHQRAITEVEQRSDLIYETALHSRETADELRAFDHETRNRLDEHIKAPMHPDTAMDLAAVKARMDALTERMRLIEQDHEANGLRRRSE